MIIFLDIDGVICHYAHKDCSEIDPKCVKLLDIFCEKIGAKIVISSSWRIIHSLEDLREFYEDAGGKTEIIGVTPMLGRGLDKRGIEILEWIKINNYEGQYIVIDDDIHDIENIIPEDKIIYVENGLSMGGLRGLTT